MGWTFVTGDTGGTGPHGGCITLPPCFTSRTSALFFLPDLAIDEIADIVVILFLFLEERIVGGFNLDIIFRHDHDLVLAGIGFFKRNQLRYRATSVSSSSAAAALWPRATTARPEKRSRISDR